MFVQWKKRGLGMHWTVVKLCFLKDYFISKVGAFKALHQYSSVGTDLWRPTCEIFKHSICNYVIVIHLKVKVKRSELFLFKLCHRKIKIPQSNKFNVKEGKLNLRIYWR